MSERVLKGINFTFKVPYTPFNCCVFGQGLQQPSRPWWRIKLFGWDPVLFGTWDGVFTTCMINIFGVVLFLRTGYLVVSTAYIKLLSLPTVCFPFVLYMYFLQILGNSERKRASCCALIEKQKI